MEPFLGQIMMFAGNFAPRGWALCDGQLLPISQNQALFSILGTTYGGDGRTTFALPDLRGRAPIHAGHGPGLSDYRLGQKGGAESVTLTVNQMPSHNHTLAMNGEGAATKQAGYLAASEIYGETADKSAPANTISNAGGNQPVSNIQPYVVVNYIIALQGIFPSRG
ncbi:MAG: phage tail protein [Myxococcales bacterium]|nr:phage tail protein [Myxococcales bacterium]MCB9706088.1 phage tail protein [Myxococcales bacterium]